MILEPASVIASAICWLSRQPGLPDSPALRSAVTLRHPTVCAWCDWALAELIKFEMDERQQVAFARLPPAAQRRLVVEAQEAAA